MTQFKKRIRIEETGKEEKRQAFFSEVLNALTSFNTLILSLIFVCIKSILLKTVAYLDLSFVAINDIGTKL